jgi:hypothetical protein
VSKGIVYIAFGEEYDKVAAYTVALSRRHVSIPITVLSNLTVRNAKWIESPGINFIYLDMPTNDNREIKNQLYKFTPYNETIYIDCDSIIIRRGVEEIFNYMKSSDIVFQNHTLWTEGKKYFRIYRDTAKAFNVSLPLRVCVGGFWAFRKSDATKQFFDLWHDYWKCMGSGRDMPSLACAIKNSGIPHSIVFKKEHKFFSFGIIADTIIVHRVHSNDLHTHYGIPMYRQNKEFDKGHRDFWDMVDFSEKKVLVYA